MAKYVTLEGLGYFLEGLRSEKFLASANTLGAIKLGYNDGISEDDLNAEGAAAVSRALSTTNNGNAYVYIGQADVNRFGLVKTNHTASDGTLPVKLDENGSAYAELNVASTNKLGGVKIIEAQPFTIIEDCLHLSLGPSLGTDALQSDGIYYTALNVCKATSDNIGGIKIGFTNSTDGKQSAVKLNDGKAYVEYPYASNSKAGLMTKDDYSKLAGIEAGANNYSLPTATTSALGGVKTGYGNAVDTTHPVKIDGSGNLYTNLAPSSDKVLGGVKTGYTQTGKNYPVQLDANSKAYVNVPWTNTTYTFGTGVIFDGSNGVSANTDNATIFAGDHTRNGGVTSGGLNPIQLGKDYEWKNTGDSLSNVNDFVEYGIYNLYGERTRIDDNLPIQNTGGGHTFRARLLVYDSSLSNGSGNGNDCCVTQVLTLSNRVGGDGNTYIRTGLGKTKSALTWSAWGKMQTNVEVGSIYSWGLDKLTDNGMYSGAVTIVKSAESADRIFEFNNTPYVYSKRLLIGLGSGSYYADMYTNILSPIGTNSTILIRVGYEQYNDYAYLCDGVNIEDGIYTVVNQKAVWIQSNPSESTIVPHSAVSADFGIGNADYTIITFVLITINDYAVASQLGLSQMINQLLYGLDLTGKFVLKKRTGNKVDNNWGFSSWEDVVPQEVPVASSTTVGGVKMSSMSPFKIGEEGALLLRFDGSLGTTMVRDGSNWACDLGVLPATNANIGGFRTGYTQTGKNYPVQLDSNNKAYVNVPWTSSSGGNSINLDASQPFYMMGSDSDCLGLRVGTGLFIDSGAGGGTKLKVKKASDTEWGGISTNFTSAGRNYQVKVNAEGNAYAEIGTATATDYGVTKVANVRLGTYTLNIGNTTTDRYYGVEIDGEGKLFVNVPWTSSSTATASTTALAITYKALSSGSTTISSLTKDTITRISTSSTAALTAVTGTLTISGFATKNSNKLTTYGLQFLVGSNSNGTTPKLVVPSSVKWANGIEPILTGGEIIDIVFTTTDGTNYLGTWTKYY